MQSGETTAEQHKKFNNFIMKLENIVEQFNQNNNPFLFNQITSKKEKEDELESLVNAGIDKKNTRTTTIGKKQTIEKLAKALYPVYEGQVQAAFRNIENETVYNLQSSSFLTKKIRTFKNLKDLISFKKETKSDPLFANSPLLKDLENSSVYRENLQISILDGIRVKNRTTGVGYSDLSDIEYVKVGMALYRNGQENREYGHFKFPIPADSGTMPLIKLKKLSISEITDKLVEVARGEYLSIIKIKELRKTNPNADIFQVENFDAKSEQFNTLDFLNDLPINYDITENFEDIEKSIKDAIQDWMDKMLETEIKEFENKGIIIKDNTSLDLKFAEGVLPTGLTESSTDFFQKFILNSFYANTQLTTLFSGNPAFYKGAVNYQKRNKQTQAQVTYLDTLRPGVDAEYNVIYLKDVEEYTTEETLKALTALINESDLSPQKKKELIVQWTTNTHNTTDGQTFISPSRYRVILEGLNRLTPEIEAALERVEKGIESVKDMALLPPIKPFMFTQKNIDGFIIPVQHKNSETLLTKSMANLIDSRTGELMSPTLKKAYELMNPTSPGKSKVDALMFESAVKVGGFKIVDFEDLNENNIEEYIHTFSNSDYGIQQETPAQ